MPTKDKVTEEIIQKSQSWLQHLYNSVLWCHTPSVLLAFIIELYEVLIVSTTVVGMKPTDKQTSLVVDEVVLKELRTMRNQLAHNIYIVESVFHYVYMHLSEVDSTDFNDACHMCGLQGDVWKELMDIGSLDEHSIINHIDATPTLLKLHLMSEITGE